MLLIFLFLLHLDAELYGLSVFHTATVLLTSDPLPPAAMDACPLALSVLPLERGRPASTADDFLSPFSRLHTDCSRPGVIFCRRPAGILLPARGAALWHRIGNRQRGHLVG